MKFTNTIKTNKRGKPYTTRPLRQANGFMKHYGNKGVPDKFLQLAVRGTFDSLAKQRFDIIWITVMHPVDNDYTKRVAILRKNRHKFIHRMPVEDRKRTIYQYKKPII
jgi:hypothetical protein